MGTFKTYDGVTLAYRGEFGADPLICLPGGPMQEPSYLAGMKLDNAVTLHLRGSEAGTMESCRADRQVDDIEAFRQHLGLAGLRLLGHSAGATLALLYATRFPQHVKEIVLVAPSPRPVGVEITDEDRRKSTDLRRDEPWYPDAIKGFEEIWAGTVTPETFKRIAPFWYGRWDDAARALDAHPTNDEAGREFYAEGVLDPAATRAVIKTLDVPVLLLAGEFDVALPLERAQEYADLFLRARLVVQAGAGHFPWLEDSELFSATVQRIP
jgi:proline iminopeptidase